MSASRALRRLRDLLDVDTTGAVEGDALVLDADGVTWVPAAGGGGGGGAPTDAPYLVTTANGDLSAEVVVGTTPGGELGGTWGSPTVDTTHSGSSHASVQAAAEATAASALSSHEADTTSVHGIADTSALLTAASLHAATGKTTPVDADELPIIDSAASNVLKKLTWANLKATLKTYFDTLYKPIGAGGVTQSYAGYNTVGATYETLSTARVYTKKITLATDGLLTSIEAYVRNDPGGTTDQVESLSVCLYSDNAGAPDRILGYNVGTTVTGGITGPAMLLDNTAGAGGADRPRWVALAIAKWLTAGDYWISVSNLETNTVLQIPYDSGTDRYYTSGGQWFADWDFYTPTTSSRKYSIRAAIIS